MIRLEALSYFPSANKLKFYLKFFMTLVAVNSALRVDLTFLQDLSLDLPVLVEVVDFL